MAHQDNKIFKLIETGNVADGINVQNVKDVAAKLIQAIEAGDIENLEALTKDNEIYLEHTELMFNVALKRFESIPETISIIQWIIDTYGWETTIFDIASSIGILRGKIKPPALKPIRPEYLDRLHMHIKPKK